MAYRTFNKDGKEIKLHDLQDKGPWCETGAGFEQVFVNKFGEELGVMINPSKADDIFAPDLMIKQDQNLADLKTQNTPFFLAGKLYGIDPQFAVTFNLKDYQRYNEKYPAIKIFFWVCWIATKFESPAGTVEVKEMEGIWSIPLSNIVRAVKAGAHLHSYRQRTFDMSGNAKSSYVLDLRNELFTRLK